MDSQQQHDSNNLPVRVRFAPSPTGVLHLGGLRTALFCWLFARHTGGNLILRIEDTDQKRFDPQSLDDIRRSLQWLGLDWDEGLDVGGAYGPYVQSQRKDLYQKYAEQLIASGHAYRSYMTAEELTAMRAEQKEKGLSQGYDRRDRYLTDEQRAAYEAEGRPSVVRFAVPLEGTTVVNDLLRGDIEVENGSIPDHVLLKSDGMATYHLAVVVDDHLMKISHVMRGQEWLPSAPLHKLIYDALGWEMPVLVHLPVILNPNGKGKMSKRKVVVDGREYPALVHEIIEAGYLPEAMFNFLTNVGWNYDAEQEIFTREEAVARFNIEGINPAPAALPYDKLNWLNGIYIRQLTPEALKERLIPFLADALHLEEETLRTDSRLEVLVPLIQERIKLLTEAASLIDWAFVDADEIVYADPKLLIGRKLDAEQSVHILETGAEIIRDLPSLTSDALESAFRQAAADMDVKIGSFFAPFRGAITGKKVSPPLFESMVALDRDEILRRIENGVALLKEYQSEPA